MENNQKEFYIILLRFSASQNNFSCIIPNNWTIKVLKNFILQSFKNEIKTSFSIIYSGKILNNDEILLSSIFKSDEKLYQLFISNKNESKQDSKFEKNLNDSKKFDVFQTAAFKLAEKGLLFTTLDKLIQSNVNGTQSTEFKLDIMGKMPIFSHNLKERISHETRKNKLNIFSHEDAIIENFPIRDYFKFEIFFKLVMFFILFGFQIKGYNLPIFISLLILYYWYNVYTEVNAYYNKREETILKKIKEDDPKFNDITSENSEYESEEEIQEELQPLQNPTIPPENIIPSKQDEKNIELTQVNLQNKNEEKNFGIENNQNLQNEFLEENNLINKINKNLNHLENNEDIKIIETELNLQNINQENKENNNFSRKESEENFNGNINNGIPEEMNDITPILEKFERKKKKKENIPEGPLKYYITFFYEAISIFVLSMIPAWCDEYEENNPLIRNIERNPNNPENIENVNNVNNLVQENIINTNHEELKEENKIDEQIYEKSENLNEQEQYSGNDNENIMTFKRINLKDSINAIEQDKNILDSVYSSEKQLNKSANEYNNENNETPLISRKIQLMDETGSKNENEYVFPENLNLDNLSYNEDFLESNKRIKSSEDDTNNKNQD